MLVVLMTVVVAVGGWVAACTSAVMESRRRGRFMVKMSDAERGKSGWKRMEGVG